ncbi:MAG: hypothetical protein ACRD0R_19770 [Acidimicrobiales bacterium]
MTPKAPDGETLVIDTRSEPAIDVAGVRSSERIRTGHARPRAVLGWTAAAAVVAAAGALAGVTFAGGDDGTDTLTARSGPAPVCTWSDEVDGPVFPANDVGSAPTPESVLVFEMCDGEWTGDVAWMHPGREATSSAGDDGLPNPWEAGNRAVERWLDAE